MCVSVRPSVNVANHDPMDEISHKAVEDYTHTHMQAHTPWSELSVKIVKPAVVGALVTA